MDQAREHVVQALEMDPKIWNGEKQPLPNAASTETTVSELVKEA